MQYPDASESSDVFTIIGREENVRQAIQQLEDLQKKMVGDGHLDGMTIHHHLW